MAAAVSRKRYAWWRKIRYRLSQFFRGLRAGVDGGDEPFADELLSAQELLLFQRMPADAQRHSLRVLHPSDYQYYKTLRQKLHWGEQLI